MDIRIARKVIKKRYNGIDIDSQYVAGSRTLREMLETVEMARSVNDTSEEGFWMQEIIRFWPDFQIL